ncbi:hypothetical protein AAVH_16444 [Aphelenchoides avenae]|nr:hypothetical protein AAVH_16444 [Aphelenchus avenae]
MSDNECNAQEATRTTPLQQPYTADFKLQVIKWAKTHRDSKNRLDVLGASVEFDVPRKDVKRWLSEAKRLRKGRVKAMYLRLKAQLGNIDFDIEDLASNFPGTRTWRRLGNSLDPPSACDYAQSFSAKDQRYDIVRGLEADEFVDFLFDSNEEFHSGSVFTPHVIPTIIALFLRSKSGNVHFRPLRVSNVRHLRYVWPQAEAGTIRPCSRCSQLGLTDINTTVEDGPYADYATVEKYHFRNERLGKRLVVEVEYYTHDLGRYEYFVETNYVIRSRHIRQITIYVEDERCPEADLSRRNAATGCRLGTLSGVFPCLHRRELEKCQLVCAQWRNVVEKWSTTLSLHDIARVQEKRESFVAVHYAPSAPGHCCDCILVPKVHDEEAIAHDVFGELLEADAYDRLKSLLRNSFVRYMIHSHKLSSFIPLLEECARDPGKNPLRVHSFDVYPAFYLRQYYLKCVDVAEKLQVKNYHLIRMLDLSDDAYYGNRLLEHSGLRQAKAVHFECVSRCGTCKTFFNYQENYDGSYWR